MKRVCAEYYEEFIVNTPRQKYCKPRCRLKANYKRTIIRDRKAKAKKKTNEFFYKWSAL
jgi:hypothetical protein